VPRYAIIARQVNAATRARAWAQSFAWHFWQEKHEVRFRKNACAFLDKKQWVFKHIVLGAESVLTARNDVLSEKITVLFWLFTTIESEESIAKSSLVIYPCDTYRITTKKVTK